MGESDMGWIVTACIIALALLAVVLIAWITENKHSEEVGRMLLNNQYELQKAQAYIARLEHKLSMASNRAETIGNDVADLRRRLELPDGIYSDSDDNSNDQS
jgi:hypothetical protein